jgi:branched-chain amino acid transport system ATP-binding protein
MIHLRCEELSLTLGGTLALINVSVDFEPARSTAIIGPNGAGKTTLLNAITGHIQLDHGRVMLGSIDVRGLPPYKIALKGIGRTFQEARVIGGLSVLENTLLAYSNPTGESLLSCVFSFGKATESKNRAQALDALRLVGLDLLAEEPAATLSYGQQRLLSIASCIALNPDLLLFDEPVAGLHSMVADAVISVLRDLRQRGRTIVFVEHDISAVRLLADDVIVMANGRIVSQGAVKEVLGRSDLLGVYLG